MKGYKVPSALVLPNVVSIVLLQSLAAVSHRLAQEHLMIKEQPDFSADNAGVIRVIERENSTTDSAGPSAPRPNDGDLAAAGVTS